jgi:PAS domain S-box-containing protein
MKKGTLSQQQLENENANLRNRLEESEELLSAIRSGEVDAFVVSKAEKLKAIPMAGADYPYAAMVEAMNEGAVTLIPDETIFFCNPCFSEMVQTPSEKLIGSLFMNLIAPGEQSAFATLLKASRQASVRGEFHLQTNIAALVSVQLSISQMKIEGTKGFSIIVTDLTDQKRAEQALLNKEKRFRALIEYGSDEVSVISADRNLLYESPSKNPTLGFKDGEFLGQNLFQL